MKKILTIITGLAGLTAAHAQTTVPVGIDFGVFFPTDSQVRTVFGSTWLRVGITPLSFQRPGSWTPTFDIGFLHRSGSGERVTLIPITAGVTSSFGEGDTRPYVAVRAGTYYADVNSSFLGVSETGFGFNANAAVGVSFSERFYIEGRYDYFSDFHGLNFSGFFISAGVRLFDIRL